MLVCKSPSIRSGIFTVCNPAHWGGDPPGGGGTRKSFLLAFFKGSTTKVPIQGITRLPVKQAGMEIPNPDLSTWENWLASFFSQDTWSQISVGGQSSKQGTIPCYCERAVGRNVIVRCRNHKYLRRRPRHKPLNWMPVNWDGELIQGCVLPCYSPQ